MPLKILKGLPLLLMLLCTFAASAQADTDRMAGKPIREENTQFSVQPTVRHKAVEPGQPVPEPKKDDKKKEKQKEQKEKADKESRKKEEEFRKEKESAKEDKSTETDETPSTLKKASRITSGSVDMVQLDSFGTISTAAQGALGIDMWDHSDHTTVGNLILEVPAETTVPVAQNLVIRAFSTATEADIMYGRRGIDTGRDLLTLRIHKLNEMGAFDIAADLYALNKNEPYNDNLARDGITALMASSNIPMACLEARGMADRLEQDEYVQTLNTLCEYLLIRLGGNKKALDTFKDSDAVSGLADNYKIIEKIIQKDNFRYQFKTAEEFSSLPLLDRIALAADSRLDYGSLRKSDFRKMDPQSVGLILHDKNAAPIVRFMALTSSTQRGFTTVSTLKDFYKSVGFGTLATDSETIKTYDKIKNWERVPFLYHSLLATKDSDTRNHLVKEALKLGKSYGLIALLPFADAIEETIPDSYDTDAVKTGLKALLLTNSKISTVWENKWDSIKSDNLVDLALQMALEIEQGFRKEKIDYLFDNINKNKTISAGQRATFYAIYESLDKKHKQADSTKSGEYENSLDLTEGVDYVMPSVSLMESLSKAHKGRHLGEVVLLSSLALHKAEPGKIHPDLLKAVLKGYLTVGLTNEAQQLSKEVVLGLE